MKFILFVACVCALLSLIGCDINRPVYYVSPYNASATSYHAMPLKKDSVKVAAYAAADFYTGRANSGKTDKVLGFGGNVYQARQFGNFQAYYGGDLSIGNYKADTVVADDIISDFDWATLNSRVGNKLFAGIGAAGGINYVLPFRGGEWRALGAEFTTHAESGAYSRFRKDLPSAAASVIARSRNFSTAGLTTEITRKTKNGTFGIQFAYGWIVGNGYGNVHALDYKTDTYKRLNYTYFTATFQKTFYRWTTYAQLTSALYAGGAKFGAAYRLGSKK